MAPPKSAILFGPLGTGKTSFAKAVASRLGWPFVELLPSRLAATGDEGLAASLRDPFADLAELESVLLFIDEVEEIAGTRSGSAHGPWAWSHQRAAQADPRIPIGPPDSDARAAIWSRCLGPAATVVDVRRLVAGTEMFTPADIGLYTRL